ANYLYREPSEWLHDAQFGWWKLLDDMQIPTRIICEDNLSEDLSNYRAIILAFSPLDLLPKEDLQRIEQLQIPQIREILSTPALRPSKDTTLRSFAGAITVPADLTFFWLKDETTSSTPGLMRDGNRAYGIMTEPGRLSLGFPFGYTYLKSNGEAHRSLTTEML